MTSIRNIVLCGFSACLAFWSLPATAQTVVSLNIPVTGLFTSDATERFNKIRLPDTGSPIFAFTFVLPRDYINNSEVLVVLHLAASSGTPCGVRLEVQNLTRVRGGVGIGENSTGLTPTALVTNFTLANTAVVKASSSIPPDQEVSPIRKRGIASA
jgi:hypothetical protein